MVTAVRRQLVQIPVQRADVITFRLGCHCLLQQAGTLGVQLHRKAFAPVAKVMPAQRHNTAATAKIHRPFRPPGPAKAGQQHGIGSEAMVLTDKHLGPIIQSFGGMCHRKTLPETKIEGMAAGMTHETGFPLP